VLTDDQFIDQVRAELHAGLEVLKPSQELLEAIEALTPENDRLPHGSVVRPAGRNQRRWRGRVRATGAAISVLAAVIVVFVVVAVALTSLRQHHSSTPAAPGIAPNNGQIAFVGGSNGSVTGLELANPDGSGVREVGAVPDQCRGTAGGTGTECFAWSADGKQLAYLAGGAHDFTLYLVGASGQHPRRLSACGDCQGVSWSPDGSQIAVGRYLAGQMNVWVVNSTTGAMRRITSCPPNSLGKAGPYRLSCGDAGDVSVDALQWPPDGQRIFFIRWGVPTGGVEAVGSLGTVRPDGSDQTQLRIPGAETAQWSPDGRELAVDSFNGVYVVDADGTVRQLTKHQNSGAIAWSPDSSELAIATATAISTVHADGKAPTHLAAATLSARDWALAPAWSPNGKELVYGATTGRIGVEGIWTINADGSGRRLIYSSPRGESLDSGPIWSPDGTQLAFSSNHGTYVVNADGTDPHRIGQGLFGTFAWQPIPSSR